MKSVVVLFLSGLLFVAPTFAKPSVSTVSAPSSDLSKVHYPAPQVSGCQLVGRAFGTLTAGGEVVFKGSRYEVSESRGVPDNIVYTGPKVRAVFTPKRAGSILEGDNGVPDRIGPDAHGTLRIQIDGFLVTTDAREHCVWFE